MFRSLLQVFPQLKRHTIAQNAQIYQMCHTNLMKTSTDQEGGGFTRTVPELEEGGF